VVAETSELQSANRTHISLPSNEVEKSFETAMSDKLRSDVVSTLKANKQLMGNVSHSYPLVLDETIDRQYSTIEYRIHKMTNCTEYVGYLEILATAFLLQKQFHIFHEQSNGCYTMVCKVPYALFSDCSPIALLHYMDTGRHLGNFDALVARSKRDCMWNLSTVIPQDLIVANVAPLLQVSFTEVFSNALLSSDICASTNESLVTASSTNIEPTNGNQHVTVTYITLTASKTESATSSTNKQSTGDGIIENSIVHSRRNGRHYISCKVCCQHADVVRIHAHRGQLPAIATEAGTIYRTEILEDHWISEWHV